MELSIFLARAFGLIMLLVGFGMFLDRPYYEKIFKDFTAGPAHIFSNGFLALIAGLAMVTYHNIWEGEWWVVLITVFAWITLLKGILRILFPKMVMDRIHSLLKNKSFMNWSAAFSVVIGLIFSYYGFLT